MTVSTISGTAVAPLAAAVERWLFWSMLAAVILPVWTTTYFPSQDGPIHLYLVHLIDDYLAGQSAIMAGYFELNPSIEPNIAFYVFGLLLGQVMDLLLVEKVYLTLLALALALAVRSAIMAVNPNAAVYSLLVAPTAFHYFVHMGFYNYSLGVAAGLFAVMFTVRRLDRSSPRDLVLIGLVALATLTIHLMAFMVLGLGIGLALAWRASRDLGGGRSLALTARRTIASGLKMGLATAPALLLAGGFFLRHGVSRSRSDDVGGEGLASVVTLASFDTIELWLMAPWIALFYGLVVYTLVRQWRGGTLWQSALYGALPLVLVLAFFVNPISTRRIALADRFIPFIVYLTIVWLATVTPGRIVARLVVAVAAVSVIGTVGYRLWIYDRFDQELHHYMAAAPVVAPGRTILPLNLDRGPSNRAHAVKPLAHAGAHVARERAGVYLRASLLSTAVYGYFPLVYRVAVDPYRHIGRQLDGMPPEIDITRYADQTGGSIDYVFLWPAPSAVVDDPISSAMREQLTAGGWRQLTVPPAANVAVFARPADAAVDRARDPEGLAAMWAIAGLQCWCCRRCHERVVGRS